MRGPDITAEVVRNGNSREIKVKASHTRCKPLASDRHSSVEEIDLQLRQDLIVIGRPEGTAVW
jgi:hypothetical protein